MSEKRRLIAPIATVFVASFCIMVVEITASRVVARYLGASLYTWTAVIGVVLAGIALGNYAGGRLADRFHPTRMLVLLFIGASASCAAIPLLNRLVGEAVFLWTLPLTLRTALHVLCVFFVPSVLLGIVAPAVTKLALDQGLSTGRTVGNMYAWASIGSIAGTFCAGFFFIPRLGTLSVIWSVAGILALLSVVYGVWVYKFKPRLSLLWCVVLAALAFLSLAPQGWARGIGQRLGLREAVDPHVIFQTESQYSYITVKQFERAPYVRKLILNRLLHSIVNLQDPANLDVYYQYPYMRLIGALTRYLAPAKEKLHVLVIGGGGYVLPRYLAKTWPGSDIEVAEIDPAVTATAVRTLGFSADESIRIFHRDARNHIDGLVWRQRQGGSFKPFHFIYGDALSALAIPYQLTTREFNKAVQALLTPDGVYMVAVFDSFRSGKFLGAVVNTLEKDFSSVEVFAAESLSDSDYARNTFVVACSMKPLDFKALSLADFRGSRLRAGELGVLRQRAGEIILTDDYAPVDYLLGPTYALRECEMTAMRFTNLGDRLAKEGKLDEAIRYYERALQIDPEFAVAHNNMASALARKGNLREARAHYEEALKISPFFAGAYANMATFLAREGNFQKAVHFYEKALENDPLLVEANYNLGTILLNRGNIQAARNHYEKVLEVSPDFAEAHQGLGTILAGMGKIKEAIGHYEDALRIRPDSAQYHNNLGVLWARKGELQKAIYHYREALKIDRDYAKAEKNLEEALVRQRAADEE